MDDALRGAFETSWPATDYADAGGFRVGRGAGAGGRVSSARVVGPWVANDIKTAADRHAAWGQRVLFRVADDDRTLIDALTEEGYVPGTPTAIMVAPIGSLTGHEIPPVTAFAVWPPLAIQRDIWTIGGIDAARQDVMARTDASKTAILGRLEDRAAGSAFAAVTDGVAMIHAVEVLAAFRRRGLAGWMTAHAAVWAAGQGATRMGLAVTRSNVAAVAAYRKMGFAEVGGYTYFTLRPH